MKRQESERISPFTTICLQAVDLYIIYMDKGQFLLYQTPDGDSQIEVKLHDDTVWLSLDQMTELFQRNKSTISRHIKNVLEDGELDEKEVVAFFAITTKHGAIGGKVQEHQVAFYNLDMIISVGYRVHSYRDVQFPFERVDAGLFSREQH